MKSIAEPVARDPRAYPVSPARVAGAARPTFEVVEEGATEPKPAATAVPKTAALDSAVMAAIEPVEPNVVARRSPKRSGLSPLQRAALHGADAKRDRKGDYVTYTVEPGDRK